jgi:GDSL-like Lipase/Acylhydrolase family
VNPLRTKILSTALAVGAALVAVSGCTEAGTAASNDNAPLPTIGLGGDLSGAETIPGGLQADSVDDVESIIMIGDSITEGSIEELHDRYAAAGYDDVLIEAKRGKRMATSAGDNPSGVRVADFITGGDDDHEGELWVVALGTNDVNKYSSPDQLAGVIDEMIDAVPDDVPLVWVDTFYRDQQEGAVFVNTVVADRLARRGNAVMAQWSEVAGSDGVLSGDGVHPTDDGQLLFADVVVSEVDEFLGR